MMPRILNAGIIFVTNSCSRAVAVTHGLRTLICSPVFRSAVALLLLLAFNVGAQLRKRIILEVFWWEGVRGGGTGPGYRNDNYPLGWFNYLADLAPGLRSIGIDAIWIPPAIKNAVDAQCLGQTGNVCTHGLAPILPSTLFGYAPFDFYDLGDKYQKGSLRTKLGTKDEFLRMVSVMHANGIEVIEDVVLNHLKGAGTANLESSAPGITVDNAENFIGARDDHALIASHGDNRFKNFRYVSFSTPATDETAADYLRRNGRWSRNWQNFHPTSGHIDSAQSDLANRECDLGDVCIPNFGRDVCYNSSAFGQSSTSGIFNPTQTTNYMRSEAARWVLWMKNQTGIDGFRWDAGKHFDAIAASPNADHGTIAAVLAGFGPNPDLVSVGEVVDSTANQDSWTNTVNADAGSDVVGTFDFPLRSRLHDMVTTLGRFDMQSIPAAQQQARSRTVPFVNNHDTMRPILDVDGKYGNLGDATAWDNGNELGGGHIDPREERLSGAYAIAFAVDGSPQVFFEDLFEIGSSGKRFSHLPTSEADLPVNNDLANIIWCHRNLRFKEGAYKVKTAAVESPIWPDGQDANDLLVIERSARAIIGVNHNHDTWRGVTIRTDFRPGTTLHDYSGANSADMVVPGDQRLTIWAPPARGDGAVNRKGYTIWGPVDVTGSLNSPVPTTQTWEMADDLGDSHPDSLQQGSGLAASDHSAHYVGQIQSPPGRTITVRVTSGYDAKRYRFTVRDVAGAIAFDSGATSGTRLFNFTTAGTSDQLLRMFLASACPESGTGGDPKCTSPPSREPTKMLVAVTYQGSAIANARANRMGPNEVVNANMPVSLDSGKRGSDRFFYVEFPPGLTSAQFSIEPLAGGTGDADLFIRRGLQATRQAFDHKSATLGSSTEDIVISSPQPGGWYLDVSGASDYSKINLAVSVR
ncbi:MAG: alpha-amylase family glycosyl hydrolase [Bryobacteraceae bacterium]